VGLDGCSYLGVDQWFTAAAVGPDSALKAIAPFCTDSDFYNDLTGDGGIPTTFVAGISQLEPHGPQDDPATDPQSVTINQQAAGRSRSYDDAYWRSLDFSRLMPTVVANNIPALTEAGWNDLYPGGNLGDYVAAQNAYFHRPLTAPVSPGMPVTPRYQAIIGPWTHGEHVGEATLEGLRLEWFDTWLKGEPTAIAHAPAPLHVFENGANRWVDTAAWPPSPDTQTYYLGSGTLTHAAPSVAGGDKVNWAAASSANSLTYTTAPLATAVALDGPADVTIYATSTTPEVELTATLNVISPDGTVLKQGDGALLGSQRLLDLPHSWYGSGNQLLRPSHPFTQAGQTPVNPGETTRYDLAVLANFTQVPAGSRLQLVVTSQPPANFHTQVPAFNTQLSPTPQELTALAGGVYSVEHSPGAASFINLPLTSPGHFTTSPVDWGPAT
jgi:predicted acyl esterase